MSQTLEAVYDGSVLRPDGELPLPPNTRVRVTVEPLLADVPLSADDPAAGSFLRTVRAMKLDGPPDWSEKWEYTYGRPDRPES